ncbi:LysR family transcriptional regulator [Streptomyces sp. NPDC004250]|uniref:LysR family transcriptional regulator n=1 Tax=Streptomyces sp. NPDC004250 TaxID=3364692 RepID=UPI0036AEA70D
MKHQPDLKLLATFLAVVSCRSMTAAAAELGYVPSAVSQHITALERDMGIELIVRRPGSRLILTAAGRSLAVATIELFEATVRFTDRANDIASREIAELRVGSYPTAMSHLLPDVLSIYKARRPGSSVRLAVVETDEGLPKVRSGDLDLLIAYRYLPEDPPTESEALTITRLGREPLILVTGAETGRRRPVELAECLDREWVSGYKHHGDRRLLHRWAGGLSITPHVTLETADLHGMLAIIRSGLAVGFIPESLLDSARDTGVERVMMPPEVPPQNRDILAVRRAGHDSPVLKELVSLLACVVEGIGWLPPASPETCP